MSELAEAFENRLQEIETYLDLLTTLDKEIQEGRAPKIGQNSAISSDQQRILYSSVYLQLYNLVEATITRCLNAVSAATAANGQWQPKDLSNNIRREWVRYIANTHEELNQDNRLEAALKLCEHLVQVLPVTPDFKVAKGEGGNWDDISIRKISTRLGISLLLSKEVEGKIKIAFKDDQGALVFIRSLRNRLAHGNVSFVECSDGVTIQDLRDLKDRTVSYLREVIISFEAFINSFEFLLPEIRPQNKEMTS